MIVRNPSSVTNYTNSIYEQFYCRTYCTVNKTRYTVDSGEKEKGKTIVWVKLTPFIPNAYCLLGIINYQ